MSILEFLILLAMAGLLGVASQHLMGTRLGGLFVSIFLGFVGAYLGKEMVSWFGLPVLVDLRIAGRSFPLIWSLLGGMLATFLVSYIARRVSRAQKPKK